LVGVIVFKEKIMDKLKKLMTDYDGKTAGVCFSLVVVLNVLISFIGQLILKACNLTSGYLYASISATFSVLAIFLTILILRLTSKKELLKITRLKKFDAYFILPAVLLAMGMFFCFGFLNDKIRELFLKMGANVTNSKFLMSNPLHLAVCIIAIGILPSFFEEVFFRGVLVSAGRKSNLIALSLSVGVMFGVYHSSALMFAYQTIYGIFLSLLAIKASSAIPSIIAHLINNVVILVLEYINVTLNFEAPLVIIAGAVLLVGFVALTLLLDKRRFKREEKCKNLWIFGALGVILCVLMAVLALIPSATV